LSEKGIIAIVGCPATGKSVVGNELAKMLHVEHIDYADYLLKINVAKVMHNEIIISEVKAKNALKKINKGIVSGVYALNYLDSKKIKSVYVLRCNPKILFYRYIVRNYDLEKIKSNMTSEYLDICLKMAFEMVEDQKVNQVDTSFDEPRYTALRVYNSIKNGFKIFDRVDWLSQVSRPFDLFLMR